MRCNLLLLAFVASCATSGLSGIGAGPEPSEIVLRSGARSDQVAGRVAAAFMDHGLPPTTTQGAIVEAQLPREVGMIAQYSIVARALIVTDDSGSTIRLYADETQYEKTHPAGYAYRVRPSAKGRAARVWSSLLAVARTLEPDSTRWTMRR